MDSCEECFSPCEYKKCYYCVKMSKSGICIDCLKPCNESYRKCYKCYMLTDAINNLQPLDHLN